MSVYQVSKETVPGRIYDGSGTATTTESGINSPFSLQKSVRIKASPDNTADIIVGNVRDAVNGFHLGPGDMIELPIDNVNAVGIVAASGTQTYFYLGM
jgi:hypothetical protein